MPAAIAIPAAAAVVGGAINASGAKSAANAQVDAAQKAADTQMQMFRLSQQTEQPYVNAGSDVLNYLRGSYGAGGYAGPGGAMFQQLGGIYGLPGFKPVNMNQKLQSFPGYQFQLQQGENAAQSDLAARGLLQSGVAGKELTQFGQGLASNYFNNYVGGLSNLYGNYTAGLSNIAQLGEAAASKQASGALLSGQGLADTYGYAGNAAAAGYANNAKAWSNALTQVGGFAGQYYRNPSAYQTPAADPTGQYAPG